MSDYEYLLHLLYCAVHGTVPQEKPAEVSFKNVFSLGTVHEVANIAYLSVQRLENKPEPELLDEWKIFYYTSVQRDEKQRGERAAAVAALHSNGIRTLEAQGTVTKTLYPSTELRMMSDIDFIIDAENLEKAVEVMLSLGYTLKHKEQYEFDVKREKSSPIEFHTEFFSEYMFNRRERFSDALNMPFSHAEPSKDDGLSYYLTDTYFYLYSVLHIIKHFETMGCGIRRILDLYYLKKAYDGKLDTDTVNRIIDCGFRENYEKLFALEGVWFEDKEAETDLSETALDILKSGNHGTGEIFLRNSIRKDKKQGIKYAKLKRLFFILFPDKEYIFINYPELRERNYSLFRCRLYRIGKKLKKMNFSHAVNEIKRIIKSK